MDTTQDSRENGGKRRPQTDGQNRASQRPGQSTPEQRRRPAEQSAQERPRRTAEQSAQERPRRAPEQSTQERPRRAAEQGAQGRPRRSVEQNPQERPRRAAENSKFFSLLVLCVCHNTLQIIDLHDIVIAACPPGPAALTFELYRDSEDVYSRISIKSRICLSLHPGQNSPFLRNTRNPARLCRGDACRRAGELTDKSKFFRAELFRRFSCL